MIMYILRRLLSGVVLLFATSIIVFALLHVGSENIAGNLLDQNATPDAVARKITEVGLDRPLTVQYLEWLGKALGGDLGRSWVTGEVVTTGIMGRIGVTLSITIGATILSALLAVLLGVVAARRGGWIDAVLQFIAVIGHAIPGFLLALGLVLLFAINIPLFRAVGYVPLTESVTGWLSTMTLPIVAMSVGAIASVSQQIRGSVLDALDQDYVRTLRSRGYSLNGVVYGHVLRNASGPALAVLGVQFIGLFGGSIVVEKVGSLPGIGQLTVQATTRSDIPVVMGVVIVAVIIVVIVNLLVDLAQAGLNPKVRLS